MYTVKTDTLDWAKCEDINIALHICKLLSADDEYQTFYIFDESTGSKIDLIYTKCIKNLKYDNILYEAGDICTFIITDKGYINIEDITKKPISKNKFNNYFVDIS